MYTAQSEKQIKTSDCGNSFTVISTIIYLCKKMTIYHEYFCSKHN